MGILITVVLPLSLAFIMFSLGLGLTLEDFKRVLLRPFAFLTGAFCQVLVLPLLAFGLATAFGLAPELAVGFMILALCPGGVTSNILSKLANGDVALSVSLTGVISLISMFTVPVLTAMSVFYFMGNDGPPVNISQLAFSMFLITAVPVLIGVLIRHYAARFAEKAEPIIGKIAVVLFAVIVIAALASNWQLFITNLPVLGPALITLNIVLLLLGGGIARLFGLDMEETKTIAIETGIQNGTLGITVGSLILATTDGFSAFALPSAVYGITMYAVTIPFVLWVRNRG